MKRLVAIAAACAAWTAAAAAQETGGGDRCGPPEGRNRRGRRRGCEENEPWVLEEQARLCQIPAPPFKDTERAKAYAQAFESLGLTNVRIDSVGNVLGERVGTAPHPHVVFSAHLDTVFPEGTNVSVSREGSVLKGPGIGDDCRGLAVVLGVVKASASPTSAWETCATVWPSAARVGTATARSGWRTRSTRSGAR